MDAGVVAVKRPAERMMSPPLRPDAYAGVPRATSSTRTPRFTPNVSRRSALGRTMVAPAITIWFTAEPTTNTERSARGASGALGGATTATDGTGVGDPVSTMTPGGASAIATGAVPGLGERRRTTLVPPTATGGRGAART